MNWGSRYILLGLLLSASMPLGCMNWEYGPPQMAISTHRGTSTPGVADTLSFIQAAQLCRSAGEELEKKGFTAEAVRQYESARKYDAQTPGVARHLAVLYDLQDNPAAAESEYLRAVQEQPHDAELLNDVGFFHYRHHRLQVAETWLRNALAVNPQCACAWTNLGRVLAEQGRAQESVQAFAHVLRPAEAYSNLGILLAKQGRSVEARTALRQAIALDPGLEQPRAFLNALPSAPDVLPPSIARATPPMPPVSVPPPQTLPVSLPLPQTPTVRAPEPSPPAIAVGATSDRPIIVNGARPTTPTNFAPNSIRSGYDAKKPIAPCTPPPPPAAPRSSVSEEGPILIRTSVFLDETRTEAPSVPKSPRPLAAMPPSKPLSPPVPPAPPQATLTDCQADAESSPAPAP